MYACIGLPFTIALVVRCVVNVATDTMALVFTAIQLDTQLDDNENIEKLIGLLGEYKEKCNVNYDNIKDCYTTVKAELAAYKNALTPGARATSSSAVVASNVVLMDSVSENC